MANGIPEWDEWNNLSRDQREYSLFGKLNEIFSCLEEMKRKCESRQAECGKCFMSVKDGKWITWAVRGLYSFIILGIAIEIVKWHFK